jgi:soluble lytic murein transglycosylase-like protein
MTTALFGTRRIATGHELHLELGRTRAILLALVATLCVAWLLSSATSLQRLIAAPAIAAAISDRAAEASGADAIVPVTAKVAPQARPEIEALAGVIAKRYRIAPEATRGLVETAYGEGQRIGLDPLLIMAVIAIESRFNPIAASDMGAQGLMQVIPGYHKERIAAAAVESVLDPHDNIRLGALVLKEAIRRGGSETAGLQLYAGSADDANATYAGKVLAEKQRLLQAVQRLRERLRA